MPPSCLSFGYSAGTNLTSLGGLVIVGSSAWATFARDATQIASASAAVAQTGLIRSIGQLEARGEGVTASRDRLPA